MNPRKARHDLTRRLKMIRVDIYGRLGGPFVAKALNVPFRTWKSYEAGAPMPCELLLRFIDLTGANPHWLLTGKGDPYGSLSLGIVSGNAMLSLVPSAN
jgi:hypothetical protein